MLRVKGAGTPVQCANTDLTVDSTTGSLVIRLPVEQPVTVAPTSVVTGRRLLEVGDSSTGPTGRHLLQTSNTTTVATANKVVTTVPAVCRWHSTSFYDFSTATYLTNECANFRFSKTMSIPMLSQGGQSAAHYYSASLTLQVTQVAHITNAQKVTTAFCAWDLYRVYFNANYTSAHMAGRAVLRL